MIVDLPRFLAEGRPRWSRLEAVLDGLDRDPHRALDLDRARELHRLYQGAAADLSRLAGGGAAAEPETRRYLEALVARAYAEIYETRRRARLRPWAWLTGTFPRAFRRHLAAFGLAAAVTAGGAAFGAAALSLDPGAREVLLPFAHLQVHPSERVAWEESGGEDRLRGYRATFSSQLMTHNTQVSLFVLALGLTWGAGTVLLLFFNGAILGAVALDYLAAGEGAFLLGWLLPHGAVEIPAILIAGQAGLVLAGALLGWGDRTPRAQRLRRVRGSLLTLAGGAALLLVWAGIVEATLSQIHEPALPYGAKIALGVAELGALALFLGLSGRESGTDPAARVGAGLPANRSAGLHGARGVRGQGRSNKLADPEPASRPRRGKDGP